MKILLSLLFIGLVVISTGTHSYFVWKNKDYKTLKVQAGIISVAIIAGIFLIYGYQDPSISSILNRLSPLEK